MNTMTIDGTTYELIPHGQGCTDVPSVVVDGKAYIGQVIPKPKKARNILLTTEDGVNICEGDTVWYVRKDFTYTSFEVFFTPVNKDVKYFSSQESLLRWIIMDKPCLSINEVKKIVDLVPYEEEWLINLARINIAGALNDA